ncbi:MAG: dihydropteroate synthase, partial [Chitinivibrionales bacterium]
TGPGHIEALAGRLENKRAGSENRKVKGVFISTGVSGRDLSNLDAPGIIGERLNVQGSRKAKEYFLNDNIEELEYIGRKQEEQGADLIDLSLAVNERDSEADDLAGMAYHLSDKLSTGFCLDSTDPEAFEKSLKCVPGSVLINSVNLEGGGSKARRILKTASEYMCPVIALPIDDEGMALDYERKSTLIDKIYEVVCTECGLPEGFLFIDPLVLTLGSGEKENRNSVTEAIKALDYMKEKYPGIRAVMGVSNVSFGLKPGARRVLNNLLLYHAGKHGLDLGIFDPGKLDDIEDYDQSIRKTGEDLLFNRSDKALEKFIEEFSDTAEFTGLSEENEKTLSPGDRLFYKIVNRDGRELEKACGDLLETTEAEKIIDDYLLAAMSRVGEMWDREEVILPFVLQSAELMQKAIKCVEPHLKKESQPSGRILLATVFGDVHDIGKNLVSIILNNQGFEILDLGKQVKVESIIEKVKQEGPDAVGLSALLVSTSKEMQKCVQSLADEGLDVPVLIGGAPVNKKFAEKISKLENGERYRGGVYYASNGFEAAGIIHDLKS